MPKPTKSMTFTAPNKAPAKRFSQPKLMTFNAFVSTDATKEQPMGTATQMRMKDNICAIVMKVPKAGANCSATVPNKARANNKPATNPTICANCLREPFISPLMTPTPISTSMIISIISILLTKKSPLRRGQGDVPSALNLPADVIPSKGTSP